MLGGVRMDAVAHPIGGRKIARVILKKSCPRVCGEYGDGPGQAGLPDVLLIAEAAGMIVHRGGQHIVFCAEGIGIGTLDGDAPGDGIEQPDDQGQQAKLPEHRDIHDSQVFEEYIAFQPPGPKHAQRQADRFGGCKRFHPPQVHPAALHIMGIRIM
ncbi:hypothetical protein SDC9_157095 [bioreactor metagenome]|uniref:Uncharacterized protein n=1 Tax=bioreactor metagenome TaxID=1076179 RepID=A0A645FBI2_9ZZZZ